MDNAIEFLYLSEEDMIKANVLDMKKCVNVIEEAFHLLGKGDYLMGGPKENKHGLKIWFPDSTKFDQMPVSGPDRRFMSMIAYLGGRFQILGNKWYGSNIKNLESGLPRSIHTMTLNDPNTSAPLAIMAGNLISSMRTGAVPGVATKYLAKKTNEVVSIVGAGVISRSCLLAICKSHSNIKKVKVFDINNNQSYSFQEEMYKELNIEIEVSKTLEDCIKGSDIISVATSGNKSPEIKDDWLKEGSLLLLTGKAQLPDELYLKNKVVVDHWEMHKASLQELKERIGNDSDLSTLTGGVLMLYERGLLKESDIASLGDIVSTQKYIRDNEREKVVFVSGGVPVEDVAWAHEVYQSALQKDIGIKLPLWDKPHWA